MNVHLGLPCNYCDVKEAYAFIFSASPFPLPQVFNQDFHNRCPNWDFKNLGCPKSLIEKIKITTLILFIKQISNNMLNPSRNVLVIILKLNLHSTWN